MHYYVCMVFALFPSFAFANNEVEEPFTYYDAEQDAYVVPLKKDENGNLVPMTEEEYKESLKIDIQTEDTTGVPLDNDGITPNDNYYEYYRYYESKWYYVWGKKRKVSATIGCTATGGCSVSKAVSASASASYSTSISAARSAITAGAGFSWTYTATDSSTYNFNLKYGEEAYIAFQPIYRRTEGTLKKYSNWDGYLSSQWAYGYSPKKLSTGELDGKYTLVYTKR